MDPVTLKLAKNYAVGPVDLTGQADGDYIRNDGGGWKPRTTAELVQDIILQDQWSVYQCAELDNRAVAGTGSAVIDSTRYLGLTTGATAGGSARAGIADRSGWTINTDYRTMDFGKPIILVSFVRPETTTGTNSQYWGYIGVDDGAAMSDPTTKGIGFRCDCLAVKGIVHDGATLTVVDLTTNLVRRRAHKIAVVSDGAGNVSWYVDDVYKANTALGPVGVSALGEDALRYWITNGAHEETLTYYLMQTNLYIKQ